MMQGKWPNLLLLALAVMLAPAVWFAGTAAVPALLRAGAITPAEAGWLVGAVQLGFVAGTLVSAIFALADRWPPRTLFCGAAMLAGGGTLLQAGLEPAGPGAFALRFVAGAAMAGIYPVGMKLASSWAGCDLGLLIGMVVGALALGSAAPHALPGLLGAVEPASILHAAGGLALLGGLLILPFRPGPHLGPRPPFDPGAAWLAVRDRRLRLANLGYLGHMWELYAMWAWVGLFLAQQGVPGDAGLPILVLWGDYVERSTRWAPRLAACRDFAARANGAGGRVEQVVLPEIGIRGNSHMLMQDDNSIELADWLAGWIERNVPRP